jgi:hypothetical protein
VKKRTSEHPESRSEGDAAGVVTVTTPDRLREFLRNEVKWPPPDDDADLPRCVGDVIEYLIGEYIEAELEDYEGRVERIEKKIGADREQLHKALTALETVKPILERVRRARGKRAVKPRTAGEPKPLTVRDVAAARRALARVIEWLEFDAYTALPYDLEPEFKPRNRPKKAESNLEVAIGLLLVAGGMEQVSAARRVEQLLIDHRALRPPPPPSGEYKGTPVPREHWKSIYQRLHKAAEQYGL